MRTAAMRVAALGMLALGLALSAASKASAVAISSNNAAALSVRLTPNADRGVVISSGDVNLNLGAVNLGSSTQTVRPATVTIQGNMLDTELDLAGSVGGGWSFDNTQAFASTGTNILGVWVAFTSVSSNTAPAQGDEYFRVGTTTGAKLTSSSNGFAQTAVGISGGSGTGRFEADDPAADMDSMTPDTKRHFWVYFRTPPTTSITNEQGINFVLSTRAGP